MVARHRVQGVHAIKSIEFSSSGLHFITNSTDRVIRQFLVPAYPMVQSEDDAYVNQELEPILRLLDPVNRVSWSSIGVSCSGRWIAGGSYIILAKVVSLFGFIKASLEAQDTRFTFGTPQTDTM